MGKGAKIILIFGVTLVVISGVLYACDILKIAVFPCFISGLLCSVVGTPYVNGIEQGKIREQQENQRNSELIAKRNYVQNNLNIFGLKDVKTTSLDERDIYLVPSERMIDEYVGIKIKDDLVKNKYNVKVRKRTRNDFN